LYFLQSTAGSGCSLRAPVDYFTDSVSRIYCAILLRQAVVFVLHAKTARTVQTGQDIDADIIKLVLHILINLL
jgi:hypothetical protein